VDLRRRLPAQGRRRRQHGGRSEAFRPISHEKDKGYWNGNIDITNAIGREYFSTSCFYTVIDNDRSRWVQAVTDYDPAVVYLAGVRLEPGEFAHLQKGPYPMLVVAPIGETRPWGRIFMRPRLVEATAAEAKAAIATRRAAYDDQVKDWQFDMTQWRRLDGADVRHMKVFELGRELMYLYYREGVGTGGFQNGNYSALPMEGPNKYATAYRCVFGEDVSPYGDVTHYAPRKMFAHVYRPGGKPLAQDINGTPGFRVQEYAEGRDVSGGYFAALFPIIPDRWKPAALWAWHYHLGIDGKDGIAKVLARGNPAYAFVNYPLDMAPKHPAASMPLTWEAPDFGYYGFRSGWRGEDQFITQIFLKAHATGGVWQRANAGTFRVLGLGHAWNHGPAFRLNTFRWMENVVLLPDDDVNRRACGRLIHRKLGPDGSGVATVDMGDVYASARTTIRTSKGRQIVVKEGLYERYGNVRRDFAFKEPGIRGLRSIAVDYSGRSGAPCLLAVVDKVRGGGRKVWTWQLGGVQMYGGERGNVKPRRIDRGDLDRTRVAGNTFTIDKGDANLKGTFVTPVKLEACARMMTGDVWFKRDKQAGKGIRMHCNGVFAEGESFFAVVTIQRGSPPPVRIEGTGLDATVTVGERTIRFDGTNLALGG
jgi:hypothetical protein